MQNVGIPRVFEDRQRPDKMKLGLDDTTTLTPNDLVVEVQTTAANNAWTLTLPQVLAAAGRIITIRMTARNSTDDVTVQDAGDSADWSDITLDAADEQLVLFSDGRRWHAFVAPA